MGLTRAQQRSFATDPSATLGISATGSDARYTPQLQNRRLVSSMPMVRSTRARFHYIRSLMNSGHLYVNIDAA